MEPLRSLIFPIKPLLEAIFAYKYAIHKINYTIQMHSDNTFIQGNYYM